MRMAQAGKKIRVSATSAATNTHTHLRSSEAHTRCHMASLKTVAHVMDTGMLMMDEKPE